MKKTLIKWANKNEERGARLALHPIAGELVGARFLNALRIETARVEFISRSEFEKRNPQEWIAKFETDERVLAVRKVPGAISIAYLRNLHGVATPPLEWRYPLEPDGSAALAVYKLEFDLWNGLDFHLPFTQLAGVSRHPDVVPQNILTLLRHGKPLQGANPSEFYQDFQPANLDAIKSAIAWDSEQMLRLHAGRLLVGCTLAHAGNILVDSAGRLYSIDHEKIEHGDGSDIEMLAQHMKPGTRAWRAVCDVANALDVDTLWNFFEDVGLDWPLGSRMETIRYFEDRVKTFQQHFRKGQQ